MLGADKPGIAGSGLGPALSRSLMAAIGGRISVPSAPGLGTGVVLSLALAGAPAR